MKRTAIAGSLSLLWALFVAFNAHAAISAWATSEGGRMRLLALSEPRNDQIVALIEIEPNPGWKTYWRNPGDAGMPPQLDFSRSTNLTLSNISFPTPEVGKDEGGRFFGYHRPVGLVLTFDRPNTGIASSLAADITIGICEKICIPFSASFDLALTPGVPEGEEFMKVQLAQSALPAAASPEFGVTELTLSRERKKLSMVITLPDARIAPEVAMETPPGLELGAPSFEPVGADRVKASFDLVRLGKTYVGGAMTLVVKSGGRAFETTLALP